MAGTLECQAMTCLIALERRRLRQRAARRRNALALAALLALIGAIGAGIAGALDHPVNNYPARIVK